ncbi:MAG: TetR/AcrR family transcriptional regulator [Actinomycetes bacterium]
MNVRVRRRPGRPVGGRPVVDRDLLLDAAERVIARDGNGASLEAIAVEAGVTKPIVYARVGSRAELSNALASRLSDRLLAAGREAIDGDLDHRTLAALFRSNLEILDAHRELFLYVTRGTGDDTPERTLFLAGRSATALAELLADSRRRGGADDSVALPWAYGIVGVINLVSLWWLDARDRPADVLADQLAELVWSGLSASSPDA